MGRPLSPPGDPGRGFSLLRRDAPLLLDGHPDLRLHWFLCTGMRPYVLVHMTEQNCLRAYSSTHHAGWQYQLLAASLSPEALLHAASLDAFRGRLHSTEQEPCYMSLVPATCRKAERTHRRLRRRRR